MQPYFKINFIGSGNVATALALELFANKQIIEKIYSRNIEKSAKLAKRVNAIPAKNISEIGDNCDIVIISVNDDNIEQVSNSLSTNAIVVHTAGSVHSNVLSKHANYGVLYPMQTFSADKLVDFHSIPLFLEANTPANVQKLKIFGNCIFNRIQELSSENRILMHVSAVFACNFTNHMYHLAKEIIEKAGVQFELLFPLIEETAKKLQYLSPKDAQTGPAVRNDENILQKHIESLDLLPKHQEIYGLISKSIMEKKNA